jgi:hypothetical protein
LVRIPVDVVKIGLLADLSGPAAEDFFEVTNPEESKNLGTTTRCRPSPGEKTFPRLEDEECATAKKP